MADESGCGGPKGPCRNAGKPGPKPKEKPGEKPRKDTVEKPGKSGTSMPPRRPRA